MRRLIESTHVTLGGEIDSLEDWAFPYLDDEHTAYAGRLHILKYGNGPLDATLMDNDLVDEFHLLLTPVASGKGPHLFDDIDKRPQLVLTDLTRFKNGVLVLVYAPKRSHP